MLDGRNQLVSGVLLFLRIWLASVGHIQWQKNHDRELSESHWGYYFVKYIINWARDTPNSSFFIIKGLAKPGTQMLLSCWAEMREHPSCETKLLLPLTAFGQPSLSRDWKTKVPLAGTPAAPSPPADPIRCKYRGATALTTLTLLFGIV